MKPVHFYNKEFNPRIVVSVIAVCMFFFSCSELHLSPWNCVEDGTRQCGQYGKVEFLDRKFADVLVVLDNSPKGQELNPQITSNINQFLKCIGDVDLKLGVISSVKDSGNTGSFGQLINMEISNEISIHTSAGHGMSDYKKIFTDTISLRTGCSYPPYCKSGSQKPLSAVKSFMEGEKNDNWKEEAFLRSHATLAIVIISPSDETSGFFSGSGATSQEALAAVYEHYDEESFIGLVVTDSGDTDNCIRTSGDLISDGVGFLTTAAKVYSIIAMDPLAMMAAHFLSGFAGNEPASMETQAPELIRFAKRTGGYAFDICKPAFGRALAYSLLKKMEIENRFPDECKQFKVKSEEAKMIEKDSSRQ